MTHFDVDPELRDVDRQLGELARRVHINPAHRRRLGDELRRRHASLPARRRRVRFAFIAPLALGAALACSLLISLLHVPGQPATPAAQAAQIAQAMARTVPTVTSWQMSVREVRSNSAAFFPCVISLQGQRLYVRDGATYLYTAGSWYRLSSIPPPGQCPAAGDVQWALAVLPQRLAQHACTFLRGRTLGGHAAIGISYTLREKEGKRADVTAWVDRKTGLIVRLNRVVRRGTRVVESDQVDYRYVRTG